MTHFYSDPSLRGWVARAEAICLCDGISDYPPRQKITFPNQARIPSRYDVQSIGSAEQINNMGKGGAVYILTNQTHTVLYTGVTSDLLARIIEHKEKYYPKSFTAKYEVNKLVYYNSFFDIEEAIAEEKRIKGGSRNKKIALINSINPDWNDLWEEVKEW